MTRKGFTLIEVMAVVVLLGLLAGGVMLSLAGDTHRARRADVIDRLTHEDELARLAACRSGSPAILRLDLKAQRLWRVDMLPQEQRLSHSWQIPASFRVQQVLRPASSAGADAAVMQIDSGIAELPFNSAGCGSSYALHLVPREAAADEKETWLVFAGLTGQCIVMNHESEVRDIFAQLGAPRPDAR